MSDSAGPSSVVVDEQEQLDKLLKVFTDEMISVTHVTVDQLQDITIKQLDDAMRVLNTYIEQKVLQNVIMVAFQKFVIPTVFNLKPMDILKVCTWLRRPEGQDAMRDEMIRIKPKKCGKTAFGAYEMALLSVYDAYVAEARTSLEEIRKRRDLRVAELQRQIEEYEVRHNEFCNKMKQDYFAVGSFHLPPTSWINQKAWEMYIADCESKGLQPVSHTNAVNEIHNKYSAAVIHGLKVEHCRKKEVKESLLRWCAEEICRLTAIHNKKRAQKLQGYFAAATGGKITIEDLIGPPEGGQEHLKENPLEVRVSEENMGIPLKQLTGRGSKRTCTGKSVADPHGSQ